MAEAHVASMLREGAIISHSGKRLPTSIGSVCVHGDGAEAVEMARHLRRSLEQQAYQLVGLPSLFL
jgi:UPF0271 protein